MSRLFFLVFGITLVMVGCGHPGPLVLSQQQPPQAIWVPGP